MLRRSMFEEEDSDSDLDDDPNSPLECPICFHKMMEVAFLHLDQSLYDPSKVQSPPSSTSSSSSSSSSLSPSGSYSSSSSSAYTHYCKCCVDCASSMESRARSLGQPLKCPFCQRAVVGFSLNRAATDMIPEVEKYVSMYNVEHQEKITLQDTIATLTQDVASLRVDGDRFADLERALDRTREDKDLAEQRFAGLVGQFKSKSEGWTRMEVRIRELEKEAEVHLEQRRSSEDQMSDMNRTIEKDRKVIQDLSSRLDERGAVESRRVNELERRVRDAEAEAETSIRENRHLAAEAASYKENYHKLVAQVTAQQQTIEGATAERARLAESGSQTQNLLTRYQGDISRVELDKQQAVRRVAELEGALARLRSDYAKVDEERSGFKDRAIKLEREVERFKNAERERKRYEGSSPAAAGLGARSSISSPFSSQQQQQGWGGWLAQSVVDTLPTALTSSLWSPAGKKPALPPGPLVKRFGDYSLMERRGSKVGSHVWRGVQTYNGANFVLKKSAVPLPSPLDYDSIIQAPALVGVLREAMLLRRLKHPNIIHLEGVTRDKTGHVYLILSPFVEMDLEYAIAAKHLNQIQIKSTLYQIIKTVHYLHSNEIVHRDLKPTSVLIGDDCTVKVCSMAAARSLPSFLSKPDISTTNNPLVVNDNQHPVGVAVPSKQQQQQQQQRKSISTAVRYTAPEVMMVEDGRLPPATANWKAADMWSIGCIMVEMLTSAPPFSGVTTQTLLECMTRFKEGHHDHNHRSSSNHHGHVTFKLDLSWCDPARSLATNLEQLPTKVQSSFADAIDLLCRLLTPEPEARIRAEDALQHRFLGDMFNVGDIRRASISVGADDFGDASIEDFVEEPLRGL